jgi:hypothetical protein
MNAEEYLQFDYRNAVQLGMLPAVPEEVVGCTVAVLAATDARIQAVESFAQPPQASLGEVRLPSEPQLMRERYRQRLVAARIELEDP